MTFNVSQRIRQKGCIVDTSQVVIASIAKHPSNSSRLMAVVYGRPSIQRTSTDRALAFLGIKQCHGVIHGHSVAASQMAGLGCRRCATGWLFASPPTFFASGGQAVHFVPSSRKVAAGLQSFTCRARLFTRHLLSQKPNLVSVFFSAFRLTFLAPSGDSKSVTLINDKFVKVFGYFAPRTLLHGVILS